MVNATRIVIVGNGGIATELVSELEEVEIVWVIKDSSITSTFVDPGAAEFFLQSRKLKVSDPDSKPQASKRLKYARSKPSDLSNPSGNSYGSALGPDWAADVMMKGRAKDASLQIESKCEVGRILTPEEYSIMNTEAFSEHSWSVYVELTNGKIVGCDFVVSATGVVPNVDSLRDVFMDDHFAPDGGMKVNERMETGIRDIFAAGDVCTTCWEPAAHWFQVESNSVSREPPCHRSLTGVLVMHNSSIHFLCGIHSKIVHWVACHPFNLMFSKRFLNHVIHYLLIRQKSPLRTGRHGVYRKAEIIEKVASDSPANVLNLADWREIFSELKFKTYREFSGSYFVFSVRGLIRLFSSLLIIFEVRF